MLFEHPYTRKFGLRLFVACLQGSMDTISLHVSRCTSVDVVATARLSASLGFCCKQLKYEATACNNRSRSPDIRDSGHICGVFLKIWQLQCEEAENASLKPKFVFPVSHPGRGLRGLDSSFVDQAIVFS